MNNYSMIRAVKKIFLLFLMCNASIQACSSLDEKIYIDKQVAEASNILAAFQVQQKEGFHIFTHGRSGELLIDEKWRNPQEIAQWLLTQNLSAFTNIQLYACEFAKGEKGQLAVNYLEESLGLCIAASNDVTGIDGDWDLEIGDNTRSLYLSNYPANLQDTGDVCSCEEYIFLNETDNGAVHKFKVENDGTLTEVLNGTDPWLSDSQFSNPHGLGTDLNGYLYIGETKDGDVRKLTCEGTLFPESDFVLNVGGTNIGSIGNILFINEKEETTASDVEVYNLCTGNYEGAICFENVVNSWGLYIDPRTDTIYYADRDAADPRIFKATLADINSGACITPFIEEGTGVPNVGDSFLPDDGRPFGLTTDTLGNIYTAISPFFSSSKATLFKYSPSGVLLAKSIIDNDGGDGTDGFFSNAIGIVYSEVTGKIYTSNGTGSADEDCISIFDTDLNYVGTGFPNPPSGNGQVAKGIAINKECCPTPSEQTIDQTYCVSGSNEQLFLNELFPCGGTICEGVWIAADAASAAIYNDCDQSISAGIATGCYSFTKSSDGSGDNAKCGTFQLNFNVEILEAPEITITADQTVCSGGVPAELSITTTATNIQWQMSTISCTEGFADIDGATAATYTPSAISATTYYRAIVNVTGDCSTGNCPFESGCITVNIDPNCTPACTTPTAPVVSVTDNICDPETAGIWNVDTPCGTGSTLEWSTDGGTTWSTDAPVYGGSAIDVWARCTDDVDVACVSVIVGPITSAPAACPQCPPTICLPASIIKN